MADSKTKKQTTNTRTKKAETKAKTEKPEAKTEKPETKKAKQAKTTPCPCGCGGQAERTFLPGHDARTKGFLQRAFRGTRRDGDTPLEVIAGLVGLPKTASVQEVTEKINPAWVDLFLTPIPPSKRRSRKVRAKVGNAVVEGRLIQDGDGNDVLVYEQSTSKFELIEDAA